MSLKTECESCRHAKAMHLTIQDGRYLFLECFADDCQCPKYVSDSEGSDIREVKAYVDTTDPEKREGYTPAVAFNVPDSRQAEYDASTDSIKFVKPSAEEIAAKLKMMHAQTILNLPDSDPAPVTKEQIEATLNQVKNDPVNHPSHYTAYPGIEVIQLTRWMSFNLGNAVKYIARAGLKDTDKEIEDLEKAIWYIKDEIAKKKGEHGSLHSGTAGNTGAAEAATA